MHACICLRMYSFMHILCELFFAHSALAVGYDRCIHTYIYIYIHTSTCAGMAHTYMYVCMYACMCVCKYDGTARTHMRVHVYV